MTGDRGHEIEKQQKKTVHITKAKSSYRDGIKRQSTGDYRRDFPVFHAGNRGKGSQDETPFRRRGCVTKDEGL